MLTSKVLKCLSSSEVLKVVVAKLLLCFSIVLHGVNFLLPGAVRYAHAVPKVL